MKNFTAFCLLALGVVDRAPRSPFLLWKKPPVVYKQERVTGVYTIGVMSTVASRYRAKMGA